MSNIKYKPTVSVKGIDGRLLAVIFEVNRILEKYQRELYITSICDGKHMTGSLHYKGLAFDFRYPTKDETTLRYIITELRASFDIFCDIVLESDHIHIEFDPHQ